MTSTLDLDRQRPILSPSGVFQFRELEMMVLDHLKATGQLKPTPDEAHAPQNADGLGGMLMDLIMVADNLGLDITQCLATAYIHRTGKTPHRKDTEMTTPTFTGTAKVWTTSKWRGIDSILHSVAEGRLDEAVSRMVYANYDMSSLEDWTEVGVAQITVTLHPRDVVVDQISKLQAIEYVGEA